MPDHTIAPTRLPPPAALSRRPRLRSRWGVGAALLLASSAWAAAPQTVQLPILDTAGGQPLMLPGFWFASAAPGERRAAVLLLHGCGGPYGRARSLSGLGRR